MHSTTVGADASVDRERQSDRELVAYRVQPMPAPTTWDGYRAARPHMIDTAGRPLELAYCPRCRGEHFTVEPHLDEVPCPRCHSTGSRCSRPSEHDAASWHRDRQIAFEALCQAREAAGIPQVARWAATPASRGQTADKPQAERNPS